MNKSLLDTDTLSEVHRSRDSVIALRARDYRAEWRAFTYSAVTVMEVIRGLWSRGRIERIAEFLDAMRGDHVIPFTSSTAELAGKIAAELQIRGLPIGTHDPMIAATAIEHGLVLVTGNTRHFERIAQLGFPLQVANWRESAR
jgi:tRNA(fMet)-specific endonuclease VapC